MKKSIRVAIAVFAMLSMAAVSFAANTGTITVTTEPIQKSATCDKAGGFSISFDDGTIFAGGDQITMDLDLGVTLCRDIDLEIGVAGTGNIAGTDASAFTSTFPLKAFGATSPLTSTKGPLDKLTSTLGGVIFKITGKAETARVTIDVMSDVNSDGTLESNNTGTLTFVAASSDSTDELRLSFLDQSVYTGTGAGIFRNISGVYDGNQARVVDNTLCIDVSDPTFTDNNVNANMDSKSDKFTWIPSNPQIAHVVTATAFQFESCKNRTTGKIIMPGTALQDSGEVCTLIENELEAKDGTDSFCYNLATDYHRANKMIIRTAGGAPFEQSNYQLQLDILVNGEEGANGVYWTNNSVLTAGYDTSAAACVATNSSGTSVSGGSYTYTNALGKTATPGTDTDCSIADTAKAVRLVTGESTLNLGVTNDYLYINLPSMAFDSSEFTAGDILSVKVTLIKAPCGELFSGAWEIGTAGCGAAVVATTATYPYFGKTGAYLNAIVVTNLGDVAGTANFTLYEEDGDSFTASEAVAARGLYVNLLNNLTWTGTGTQGDSRGYVVVTADFSLSGAAMITNPSTGESIGYIPK